MRRCFSSFFRFSSSSSAKDEHPTERASVKSSPCKVFQKRSSESHGPRNSPHLLRKPRPFGRRDWRLWLWSVLVGIQVVPAVPHSQRNATSCSIETSSLLSSVWHLQSCPGSVRAYKFRPARHCSAPLLAAEGQASAPKSGGTSWVKASHTLACKPAASTRVVIIGAVP